MSLLVNQQQETIEVIETQAATVEHDTETGYVEVSTTRIITDNCSLKHATDAVKSARAARKKRWICFFIVILIIVIIAAVIGGYYASQNKK
jgi:syntaxin 1B/2/3